MPAFIGLNFPSARGPDESLHVANFAWPVITTEFVALVAENGWLLHSQSHCMPHTDLAWQLPSSKPEHIANARVAAALLRIYRGVQLPPTEMNLAELARPFWPLIRKHPELFGDAIRGCRVSQIPSRTVGRPSLSRSAGELDEWIDTYVATGRPLPDDPDMAIVLAAVGNGLLAGSKKFAVLFDAVERDLLECVQHSRLPVDQNIDMLSGLLNLSREEKNFFSLCAAVSASTIGSDPFSFVCTPIRMVRAVQHAIAAPDEYSVRTMLRYGSRLFRSGLLNIGSTAGWQDMEDVLLLSRKGMLLLSCNATSPAEMAKVVLSRLSTPSNEDLLWPHLADRARLLEQLMTQTLRTGAKGVNILLYGGPGTGKTQFAASLIKKVASDGYAVADVDEAGDAASREERLANLALSQAFAPTGRSVIVLDEAEDIFTADYSTPLAKIMGRQVDGKSWMNNLLENNAHPVIWISNRIDNIDPAHMRRFAYCLEFPQTPRGVRMEIAHRHLDSLGCSRQLVDTVGSDASISPGMLASAARFTRLIGLEGEDVDRGVRAMLSDMVHSMGLELNSHVPERSTRFDLRYMNVRGAVTVDAVLGALERSGRGRVLLSGPPGTGKTQLAAEAAQRLGRELIYKTASDLNSKWFGESERNVARMFKECDPKSDVLLLDEADTLFGSREATAQRVEVAVTAEFLRQVESFQGVLLCATNFGSGLDSAFMRRFEFRLDLQPLSFAQRLDLFCETALGWVPDDVHRPQINASISARIGRLDRLTPGDFANVVRRVRALQLDLDACGWVDQLQAEQDAKPGAARAAVGFL